MLPNGVSISTTATYGNLTSFLESFFQKSYLGAEDNFWFFFAGHGERYKGRDYLMPMDANAYGDEILGLSVDYVRRKLCQCGASNIVLILDACRNQGSRSGQGIGEEVQEGVITISSCQPTQKSWEIDALKQGVFTHAFLEAFKQHPEHRACATVAQLSAYLRNRVPQLCKRYGKFPVQVPRISIDPVERQNFILFPKNVQKSDIDLLKLDAYRMRETNPILARDICVRLNSQVMGEDLEVIRLLAEIYRQSDIPVAAQRPSVLRQEILPQDVLDIDTIASRSC